MLGVSDCSSCAVCAESGFFASVIATVWRMAIRDFYRPSAVIDKLEPPGPALCENGTMLLPLFSLALLMVATVRAAVIPANIRESRAQGSKLNATSLLSFDPLIDSKPISGGLYVSLQPSK